MATRRLFWGLVVFGLFLSFPGTAVSQEEKGTTERGEATPYDYSNVHSFPNVFSPYNFPFVPEPLLENSPRLKDLIVDGKLVLNLDDAIALALENNLAVAVARYNLPIAQTDLLRAKAGGAARGVAGAYQSETNFSGELGAGVSSNAGSGSRGAGGALGGGIPGVSAVGCCDPAFRISFGWDHAVTPLNYTVLAGVPIETDQAAVVSGAYSQGFLTGTGLYVGMSGYRQAANATTELFNPYVATGLTVGVTQQLLNGFGYRANAKFIRQAQNDLNYSESVFRQNVINEVGLIMTTYFDLLADQESIRVAQEGLGYAKKLLENNQVEAKIGAVARYDVVRSQAEVASRKQELLTAQHSFSQDAQSLKAIISKSFNTELAMVEVDPTDHLPEPHPDDIPALPEALQQAATHRPEIEQAEINLRNQEVTIQALRNALLPSLNAYALYTPSGLAGALGPSLSGTLHARYPNYGYGVTLSIPIRNRTAEADAARGLLEQRQLQIKLLDAKNQAVWDVSKAVSAAQQARDQLEATQSLAALLRQVLDMQQQKFTLSSATVEDVITAQRNLANAEGDVVRAHATYAKALIQYEQATGTLLERNNISLSEAEEGEVHRTPNIPGTPEQVN